MNDNRNGDPRDQIDAPVRQQQGRQEIVGSTESLGEQTLAVDLANAEIDRLIATAHRYPRKLEMVVQQLEQMVLFDEASAENSVYALPRGGKPIVGPSIGFANSAATAWGNCWDYGMWLHTDRREKVVVGQGIFIDWQTNRRTTISEQRRIVGSKGHLFTDDMIIVTSKAASAVARRNAILAGIPRPIWFPIYEKALFVVRGTEQTLAERREKAIKALMAFGIEPKQVFLYLGVRDITEVGIEHMPTLRGMYAQLRDGSATPEEMFDPRKITGKGFEQVENPLADEEEDETATGGKAKPAAAASTTTAKPTEEDDLPPGGDQGGEEAAEATETADTKKGAQTVKPVTPKEGNRTASAEPAKASTKPAAKEAEPKKETAAVEETKPDPATSDEYVAHAEAWLAASRSAAAVENKWKSERNLRTACSVVEDAFADINGKYRARVAELKGAK